MAYYEFEWPHIRPPFRMLVAGSSGSGKTYIVKQMLENMDEVFGHTFATIKYCFRAPDPLIYEVTANLPQIEPCDGIPMDYITNPGAYKNPGDHVLLILDDLIHAASKSAAVDQLFAVNARHWNISVILITQNVYIKSPFMVNISLNTTHMIVTENKRNPSQFFRLAQQLEPALWRQLVDAHERALKMRRYGYLIIDLDKHTSPKLKYYTGLLQTSPRFYYELKPG
jgi:hypothetical protein